MFCAGKKGGKIHNTDDARSHLRPGSQTIKMPPKKPPLSPRTPRIRAFKFVAPKAPSKTRDEDEGMDDIQGRKTRPVRQILTAAAAQKKKKEMSEASDQSMRECKPATSSVTKTPVAKVGKNLSKKSNVDDAGEPCTTEATKTKGKSSVVAEPERGTPSSTPSMIADESEPSTPEIKVTSKGKSSVKTVKHRPSQSGKSKKRKHDSDDSEQSMCDDKAAISVKSAKKIKPSSSKNIKPQVADSDDSDLENLQTATPKASASKSKKTKGETSKVTKPQTKGQSSHVPSKSKSGKKLTSKSSIGNQPYENEGSDEATAPQDEAEYFASSDEDPRQAQIKADAELAKIMQQDAVDSPLTKKKYHRRKWTVSEDEAIIEHVKTNPIFYNKQRTDYIDRKTKNKIMGALEPKLKLSGKNNFS